MKRVLTALAATALLLVAIPTATATATAVEGVPQFGHVFVIIGENTELGQINKSNAPFLLGTVKPELRERFLGRTILDCYSRMGDPLAIVTRPQPSA